MIGMETQSVLKSPGSTPKKAKSRKKAGSTSKKEKSGTDEKKTPRKSSSKKKDEIPPAIEVPEAANEEIEGAFELKEKIVRRKTSRRNSLNAKKAIRRAESGGNLKEMQKASMEKPRRRKSCDDFASPLVSPSKGSKRGARRPSVDAVTEDGEDSEDDDVSIGALRALGRYGDTGRSLKEKSGSGRVSRSSSYDDDGWEEPLDDSKKDDDDVDDDDDLSVGALRALRRSDSSKPLKEMRRSTPRSAGSKPRRVQSMDGFVNPMLDGDEGEGLKRGNSSRRFQRSISIGSDSSDESVYHDEGGEKKLHIDGIEALINADSEALKEAEKEAKLKADKRKSRRENHRAGADVTRALHRADSSKSLKELADERKSRRESHRAGADVTRALQRADSSKSLKELADGSRQRQRRGSMGSSQVRRERRSSSRGPVSSVRRSVADLDASTRSTSRRASRMASIEAQIKKEEIALKQGM